MGDVNELLEQAIKETENLNKGEVFLVKDLFKGYVWNRIPRKYRLLLGTLFLNYVNKMEGNIKDPYQIINNFIYILGLDIQGL
jgi:hypothetical protein